MIKWFVSSAQATGTGDDRVWQARLHIAYCHGMAEEQRTSAGESAKAESPALLVAVQRTV